jgi:tRNA A-37 threonylcarbamoyl transferase component Bud32
VRGDRFYGRTDLIGEILEGPRDAIWALGTRRIGKTSLLKQLEYLTANDRTYGFFPLFWDLQGADTPSELHAGFGEALLDAEERLEELGIDAEKLASGDLFGSLRRLRRDLRSKDYRLLLLCDEVEELVTLHRKDQALLRKLRHSLQASGEIRSVLASTIKLWELAGQREDTSPFLHGISPPAFISRLDDKEAHELVVQSHLEPGSRPRVSRADVEELCAYCDNHPYLVQLVGKRLQESGTLEAAVEQVAADAMVSYFFSVDFEMLAPLERRLLRALACDGRSESRALAEVLVADLPIVRGAIQHLDNLGFVRRRGAGSVELTNSFFRRWLTDLAPDSTRFDVGAGTASADKSTLAHLPPRSVLDDRYELQREVGEGATGIVYEAWDRLLRTRIAVKLLRPEYAGNRAVLERFRKEILLSRNLGHPNILRVYHLGQQAERAYLTMQWVDGPTLAEAIEQAGRLSAERVIFLGSRLASALQAAHSYSVLHRDIKPQNIMLDRAGEPLIMDFGLARLLEDPGLTASGVFLGTPNYVSPEQAALETLDERSDVYSLGVVLYEMATGGCPFSGETVGDVLAMHREQRPEDPRDVFSDIPGKLAQLILRCLEKDPASRYGSAGDLRADLEGLLPEGAVSRHPGPAVSHLGGDEDTAPGAQRATRAHSSANGSGSRGLHEAG